MPLTTNAQRLAKWRLAHPEKVVEFHHKYYYENKEKESLRQHKKYIWNKESRKFMNILI